ncbi:MAG: TolC family protein [Verrucomicrobiales bacterium]
MPHSRSLLGLLLLAVSLTPTAGSAESPEPVGAVPMEVRRAFTDPDVQIRRALPPKSIVRTVKAQFFPPSLIDELSNNREAPVLDGEFSLRECLELALENNRKRPASRFDIEMAEAQHRQALAAYWPQITAQGLANLRSDNQSFVFPESTFHLPATSFETPEMQVALPNTTLTTPPLGFKIKANSIAPGFPPSDLDVPLPPQQVPINGQSVTLPSQQFDLPEQSLTIPEQEIQLLDRVTYTALADVKWLLFDGGWRSSLRTQAKRAIDVAREDARRTDLEIIYDVTRFYKGAVLAGQVERLGDETLIRMDTTLEMTEKLYKGESLKVTRLDYTRSRTMVEEFRVRHRKLVENRRLAETALVHAMGLSWKSKVTPSEKSVTFDPLDQELEHLISDAYCYSPDWKKIELGLEVFEAQIKEQRSAAMPRIAFLANAQTSYNKLDTGFASSSNLNSWNVGIGVELPIFTGGLTKNRIHAAKARLAKLKEQKVLLREGLAWGVKSLYQRIETLEEQEQAAQVSESTAIENREVHDLAYRNDLTEAADVFEAQIMEAAAKAGLMKIRFDHTESRSKLSSVIGESILEAMGLAESGNSPQ